MIIVIIIVFVDYLHGGCSIVCVASYYLYFAFGGCKQLSHFNYSRYIVCDEAPTKVHVNFDRCTLFKFRIYTLWFVEKRRSDRDLEIFRRISFFLFCTSRACVHCQCVFFSPLCQKMLLFPFVSYDLFVYMLVCVCVFFLVALIFLCTVFFFILTSRSWKSCTRLWCAVIFRYADAISYGFHIHATVSTE